MAELIDLVNQVQTVQALAPQVLAATTQGSSTDMSDCEYSTGAIVDVGAITVANVTSLVVQIEEWSGVTNGTGNGGTTWAAIPGMVVTVTATTAGANTHQVVRGQRTQQFVRANAVTLAATTTTGAFPCSVEVIAQRKYVYPSGDNAGNDNYPSS